MKFIKKTLCLSILLCFVILVLVNSHKITNTNYYNLEKLGKKFHTETVKAFLSTDKKSYSHNKELPLPGKYAGDCLHDKPGVPYCTDPRLRCADLNNKMKCYIAAWRKCDKAIDFDTTCADLNFKCINYKIKDSTGSDVALCASKGTYMDSCSSTNPCSKGFSCTEITVQTKKEKVCLVDKSQSCSDMKLCATGYICDNAKKTCEECQIGKNPIWQSEQRFQQSLKNSISCDELKKGAS